MLFIFNKLNYIELTLIISILALIIVFFGKTIRQIIDNTNKKVL